MARPPHPDRHPHRRGARDARGAARARASGRLPATCSTPPQGSSRPPRPTASSSAGRHTSRPWTRSRSARPSPSRRRGRPSRSRSGRSSERKRRQRNHAARPSSSAARRSSTSSSAFCDELLEERSSGPGGDRRLARRRQEPPTARIRATPRGAVRRPSWEVPLVRRGHHVLADRGDLQVRGGHPAERRPRGERAEARQLPRDAPHRRPRRAPDDRVRALQPDRHSHDAARDVCDERDLAGRAPLGDPAHPAAARVGKPTAVVVEDLHWAEPTLLELIAYLLAEEAGVPLAVIATTRPEIEDYSARIPGPGGTAAHRRPADTRTRASSGAAERSHR